jgi:predicted AAA+ superfamily ATPase
VLPALKKIKQLEPKTYEMFLDEIAKMEGLLP